MVYLPEEAQHFATEASFSALLRVCLLLLLAQRQPATMVLMAAVEVLEVVIGLVGVTYPEKVVA